MYAAPVDLHNARLVVCFGAKRGCVLQANVKSAYLQALLGGNATWLKIPKSLMHLFPQRARSMKQPVVRLIRALYGHPRAGSDWDAHLRSQLLKHGWQPIANQKGLFVVIARQNLHHGDVLLSVFRDLLPLELCFASECHRYGCPAGICSNAVATLQNSTRHQRSPEKG